MLAQNLFVLAAAATGVSAQYYASDSSTTTSTLTQTQTVTITKCNPTYTDCPAAYPTSTSSSSASHIYYPVYNASASAYPTAYYNSTTYAAPTGGYPVSTPLGRGAPVPFGPTYSASTTPAAAPTVVASGAQAGPFLQSGLLLAVVGAGVALLA